MKSAADFYRLVKVLVLTTLFLYREAWHGMKAISKKLNTIPRSFVENKYNTIEKRSLFVQTYIIMYLIQVKQFILLKFQSSLITIDEETKSRNHDNSRVFAGLMLATKRMMMVRVDRSKLVLKMCSKACSMRETVRSKTEPVEGHPTVPTPTRYHVTGLQ